MKLLMAENNIRAEGGKALAEALKDNTVMTELDIAGNWLGYSTNDLPSMSGVIAIGAAIPTMGALASLNLANNRIRAEGAKHIAAALPQCK